MSDLELSIDEYKVLKVFGDHPDDAFHWYYTEIVAAVDGDETKADEVCRELRRRKLVTGVGRGSVAHYQINKKGYQALEA
jgi:hypothetical protein